MFKRFSVAEDVSTQTAFKSSAVRALKKAIADALPAADAGAGAALLEVVLPPARKGEVLEGKGRDRSTFVVLDGVPLFFKARDGPSLPTLRLLCVRARNRSCVRAPPCRPRATAAVAARALAGTPTRCCCRACKWTRAPSSSSSAAPTSCAAA
jgi:hypothetical protein